MMKVAHPPYIFKKGDESSFITSSVLNELQV